MDYQTDKAGMAALGELINGKVDDLTDEIAVDAEWYAAKRTGEMAASVEAEVGVNPRIVRASSGHDYYQEVGTKKMPAQPFLRTALYQEREL